MFMQTQLPPISTQLFSGIAVHSTDMRSALTFSNKSAKHSSGIRISGVEDIWKHDAKEYAISDSMLFFQRSTASDPVVQNASFQNHVMCLFDIDVPTLTLFSACMTDMTRKSSRQQLTHVWMQLPNGTSFGNNSVRGTRQSVTNSIYSNLLEPKVVVFAILSSQTCFIQDSIVDEVSMSNHSKAWIINMIANSMKCVDAIAPLPFIYQLFRIAPNNGEGVRNVRVVLNIAQMFTRYEEDK